MHPAALCNALLPHQSDTTWHHYTRGPPLQSHILYHNKVAGPRDISCETLAGACALLLLTHIYFLSR
eukprot:4519600-Pyramimonas_sp.AAC.2